MNNFKNKCIIILAILLLVSVSYIVFSTILHIRKKNKIIQENEQLIKEKDEKIKKYKESIDSYTLKISERDKEILDLKKNSKPEIVTKIITKEVIKYMTDEEKDKTILDLQADKENLKQQKDRFEALVNSDTALFDIMMKDLKVLIKDDLPEAIKKLKETTDIIKWSPNWGIEISENVGITSRISFISVTNLNFKKYFLQGKLWIGSGLGFIIEKDLISSQDYSIMANNDTVFGAVLNLSLGYNF